MEERKKKRIRNIFNEEKTQQLKALMRLKPTLADTAAFFECNTSTIEKHIRKVYDRTYSEFRDQNMVHTRFSLIRTAIGKAESGDNVMLIFCLKNLCGWKDKWDNTPEDSKTITLNYNLSKGGTDGNDKQGENANKNEKSSRRSSSTEER
jgi:hypothetical protein